MNSTDEIKPLVFISHASEEDGDIALKFQEWIIKAYNKKVATFVSSADGIKPNQTPIEAIKENLNRAIAIVVLHTPNTTEKHWLSFESGWGYGGRKMVLHLLCKEAEIDDLPNPVKEMAEIKSSEKQIEFEQILTCLDEAVGLKHVPIEIDKLRLYLWTGEEEINEQKPVPHQRNGSRIWWL